MPVSRNIVFALAALIANANAAMGPAFSTGPTSSDTYIIETWATLTLPTVPTDNTGDLSLWVGMGTSNGDLIQSIAENYNADDWSAYAYTLQSTSATTQAVVQAEGSTAEAGQSLTFHYLYDDSTGNYTQTVYLGSSVISTLSTSDGEAEGFGSSVECAEENCGLVPAHTWSNVSVTLSGAYPGYIDTFSIGQDVVGSMSTDDDGVTWTIGTVEIPAFDFSTLEVVESDSSSSSSSSTGNAAVVASASSSSDAAPAATGNPYGSGSDSGSGSGTAPEAEPTATGSWTGGSWGQGGSGSGEQQPTGAWGAQGAQPTGGHGGHGGHHHSWERSRIAQGVRKINN